MENNWWLVFFWSGPLGIGLFLVCLGVFIWLVSKADEVKKRTRVLMKEHGLDEKK